MMNSALEKILGYTKQELDMMPDAPDSKFLNPDDIADTIYSLAPQKPSARASTDLDRFDCHDLALVRGGHVP